MAVASMVIGIMALIVGFIPCCGNLALLPAIVGTGLAISDLVMKRKSEKPKGTAIAGLVLNSLAIVLIVLWNSMIFAHSSTNSSYDAWLKKQQRSMPALPLNQPPNQPGKPMQPVPPNQPMQPMQPVPPNQPMQPMQPAQPDTP